MVNPVGNEIIQALGQQANGQPAATTTPFTLQQVANLAATESTQFSNTGIGTVGNGTLTASAIVGGLITRSGPTANYTDTTDTAANIVAALPSAVAGSSFPIYIKNATAFNQTLAAGTGVTLPPQITIYPFEIAQYEVTIVSATAVTLTHMSTDSIINTYTSSTALATATNTSTFTAIPGFSVALPNSGTYTVLGAIQVNSTAGGGASLAFGTNPSGTLTASSLNITGKFYTGAGISVTNIVSLQPSPPTAGMGSTSSIVLAEFTGSLTTTAAGNFQVYGGQQAANAGSTNFLQNGWLQVERVS